MTKKENNYAFIDWQNLYMSIKSQEWVLDYARFRKYLADKYHVEKAFIFIGFIATNSDLYESLQNYGYTLIFKPILEAKKVKGNVDAELVLHAMIEYKNYDKAVIISGDGDFYCLVKHLKAKGKLCKLLVPDDKRYSSLYRKMTESIAGINLLKGKMSYKKKGEA